MRPTLCLAVLLCAFGVDAQGTISPAHFANAEGNTAVGFGLGESTAPTRYLETHAGMPAATISSVAVRRDSLSAGQYPAGSWVAHLFVSSAALPVQNIDRTFDRNHGTDKTQLANNTTFSFPATGPSSLPQPFAYKLPFSQPFNFAGGVNGLCWEVQILSRNQTGPMLFDGAGNWSPNPTGEVWEGGTGCKATGQTSPAHITGAPIPDWLASTLQVYWNGSNLPKNAPTLLSLGLSDKTFGGVPLPFTLPGTASAPSGPCTLYNDAQIMVPLNSDAQGQINPTANGWLFPGLHGFSLFAQAIGLDAAANSFGAVLTNTVQFHLIEPWSTVDVGHVYLSNSLGSTGTSVQYVGQVVKFE